MTTDNLDPDDLEAAATAHEEYDEEWRPAELQITTESIAKHAHLHGFAAGAAHITRTQCVPLAAELAKATRQPLADMLHPTGSTSLPGIRHPFTTNPKADEQQAARAEDERARPASDALSHALKEYTADPEKWREDQIVQGSRVIADRLIDDLRGVQLTDVDAERVERVLRSRIRPDVSSASTRSIHTPTFPDGEPDPKPLGVDDALAEVGKILQRIEGDGHVLVAKSDEPVMTVGTSAVTQEQFAAVRDHLVKQLGGAAL